jgi:hypothetical protein
MHLEVVAGPGRLWQATKTTFTSSAISGSIRITRSSTATGTRTTIKVARPSSNTVYGASASFFSGIGK